MGEAQLDLLERLLTRIEHYAATVTREQLESDLDTWLMVSRARASAMSWLTCTRSSTSIACTKHCTKTRPGCADSEASQHASSGARVSSRRWEDSSRSAPKGRRSDRAKGRCLLPSTGP